MSALWWMCRERCVCGGASNNAPADKAAAQVWSAWVGALDLFRGLR